MQKKENAENITFKIYGILVDLKKIIFEIFKIRKEMMDPIFLYRESFCKALSELQAHCPMQSTVP